MVKFLLAATYDWHNVSNTACIFTFGYLGLFIYIAVQYF